MLSQNGTRGRAFLNLRHPDSERARLFHAGLRALGFTVEDGVSLAPRPGDLLVSWNRIREGANAARAFEAAGLPVVIVENATWGNDFLGEKWLSLSLGRHNTAGTFPVGGPERWDRLGAVLSPFRTEGEPVVLPQRGIGPEGVRMPLGWTAKGRVRRHPGNREAIPLEQDLARCGKVITWGSGAAVKALMMGIPVESHMPNWVAEQDNTEAGRLAMFRRLAWGQWRLSEIESGEAFRWLFKRSA